MLERLEDRRLLAASVEAFPIRMTGGNVAGITSGMNGDPNLYFTMPGSNTIGVYNPKTPGTVGEYPIPTFYANAQNLAVGNAGAGDLVAGSDGNIYFLESAANQIGVFNPKLAGPTPAKVITEYPILSSNNAGLQAITSGPDGNIWFTESKQDKIGQFNITTHLVTEFNVPTSLSNPYGITSDPAGDAVWFTESNTNNIGNLNLQTHVFSEFKLGSSSLNPGNIAYDSTNGNVYFVETQTKSIGWLNAANPTTAQSVTGLQDTSINDHLTVDSSGNIWATDSTAVYVSSLNVSTGKLTSFYSRNSNSPKGITLGSDGRLWVGGSGLEPFTTAGVLGTSVGIPATTNSLAPGAVTTDANGNLWFSENATYSGRFDSFSLSTQETYEFTAPSGYVVNQFGLDTQNKQVYFTEDSPSFLGGLMGSKIGVIDPTTGVVTDLATLANANAGPQGITYDAPIGGNLWFTEFGGNKIAFMSPGGNVAEINTTPAGETSPYGIIADASGNLWVSWYGSGTVDRFTPTGAGSWLTKPITLGGGTSSHPKGITVGPDGNIWVREAGQVEVIDPSTLAIIKSISITGNGSITSRPEDNSVWVTTSTSVIAIATGSYTQTAYAVPSSLGGPVSVVADGTDHDVYFTNSGPGNGFGGTTAPYTIGAITLNSASQPDHLAITTPPPANVTKGVGFGLIVGVETNNNTVDGFLNTIDGPSQAVHAFGGFVTISLGANPNGDTLGGTLTEPVNNGVAVFSGLTLDNPGPGEILSISYTGLSSISSSPITVALAASKIAVEAQPPLTVGAGQEFIVAFEAVDSNGNLDTSYNGPISVTTGVNPTGVNLGGTTLLGATNGIATFSTLTLSEPGPGYTIEGSDPNGVLSPISSRAFTVTSGPAASIASTAGTPQSAAVGTAFATAFQATVKDQFGNPVSGVSVIFAAPASGAGGGFAGGGTTTVTTNSNGVATAPAFTANTVAGSYSVTATVAGVSAGATFSLSNTGLPITVSASLSSPIYGQALSFTATLGPVSSGPAPGGTVQFLVDGSRFGTAVTVGAGTATSVSTMALAAGRHTITASYSGDPNYAAGSGAINVTVTQALLTVTANALSVPFAAPIPPLTYSLSGFVNGETAAVIHGLPALATAAAAGSTVVGSPYPITVDVSRLTASNYALKGVDSQLTVVPAASVTTLALAGPALPGQATTFTAAIRFANGAVTEGNVTFTDGGVSLGTVPVNDGAVSFSTILSPSEHAISAVYSGGPDFVGSPSNILGIDPLIGKINPNPNPDPNPNPAAILNLADFNGDGKTDLALFDQSNGVYFAAPVGSSVAPHQFGNAAARLVPVTGDFDGDGKTDLAAYSLAYGVYYIAYSSGSGPLAPAFQMGNPQDINIPVTGDYNGDGKSDPALFDASLGIYFVSTPSGPVAHQFGNAAARLVPVTGDFDGDGKTDLAAYSLAYGVLYIQYSGGGAGMPAAIQFGNPQDINIPIASDFTGDGKADPELFDATLGIYYIAPIGRAASAHQFGNGAARLLPAAGDYDGDGKADFAAFSQAYAAYYVAPSSAAGFIQPFGNNTDTMISVPGTYVPPVLRTMAVGDPSGFVPLAALVSTGNPVSTSSSTTSTTATATPATSTIDLVFVTTPATTPPSNALTSKANLPSLQTAGHGWLACPRLRGHVHASGRTPNLALQRTRPAAARAGSSIVPLGGPVR